MTKRISVILPETTIRTIDHSAKPRQRNTEAIRKRLEIAAVRDRDLDSAIAQDWFAVDEEA
jgi:hypothetical protein